MNRSICSLALALSLFASTLARPAPAAEAPRELWLYYATNLQAGGSVEKAQAIWSRAAKAGYTHILLADSKLAHLKDVPDVYYKNVERAKAIAAKLHLTLVPAMFDVGYSNAMLANDPNLAEGLPVRDTPFVVHGARATVAGDHPIVLGKPSFADPNLTIAGHTAEFTGGPSGNSRFNYTLKLPDWRCYHVSVEIKTDDFHGEPKIAALGAHNDRSLQWQNLHVAPTQDWKRCDVVFDTLDSGGQVGLYFGVWGTPEGAKPGSLRWRDWKIEEVGLVNVLRRDGTPIEVKTQAGVALKEGADFAKIVDPRMGTVPWPGEYESWHEPPAIELTPAGVKAAGDGGRLMVSWYYPPIIYDEEVSACISAPGTKALLADEARRVEKLFDAPGYMMSHDEFRCFGWDESCKRTGLTPGAMLADNVRDCRRLIGDRAAYDWNDMFDPYHNAVKGPYFLVNGPWTDSWKGLSKDITIINWNYGKRDQSLKFFAGLGNKQIIAGYYDGSMDTAKWRASAAGVEGVVGYMYTTWRGDFSQIDKFAREAGAPAARDGGRGRQ